MYTSRSQCTAVAWRPTTHGQLCLAESPRVRTTPEESWLSYAIMGCRDEDEMCTLHSRSEATLTITAVVPWSRSITLSHNLQTKTKNLPVNKDNTPLAALTSALFPDCVACCSFWPKDRGQVGWQGSQGISVQHIEVTHVPDGLHTECRHVVRHSSQIRPTPVRCTHTNLLVPSCAGTLSNGSLSARPLWPEPEETGLCAAELAATVRWSLHGGGSVTRASAIPPGTCTALQGVGRDTAASQPAPTSQPPPPPLCDIPSGCCSFTGPWTVTRSSLRMLCRVATFCRPLRPVLLLVSFPRSRSPVVGVLGLC